MTRPKEDGLSITHSEAAQTPGVELQRRVDLDNGGTLEAGGYLDDLSISGEHISLIRLERMGRRAFWGRIYMRDGQDIVLSISAPKGKVDVTAETDGPARFSAVREAAGVGASPMLAELPEATAKIRAERDEAVRLGNEMARDLESEVESRYVGILNHPAMKRRYLADMDVVVRFRAFLTTMENRCEG